MSGSLNYDNNDSEQAPSYQKIINEIDNTTSDNEKPQKSETQDEGKCAQLIKRVSLGQYKTPLYFQKEEFYSSITGGIITILCFLVFFAYGVWLLIGVINKNQWILDAKSNNLSFLRFDLQKQKYEETCADKYKSCQTITMEQFVNAYFEHQPKYCITYTQDNWPPELDKQCLDLQVQVKYELIKGFPEVIKSYTKWTSNELGLKCCIELNATDIIEAMIQQKISLAENALFQLEQELKYEYQSRIYIQFYGLKNITNQVQIVAQSNIKVTSGGKSLIQVYAPLIPYSGKAYQKLSLISFTQYSNNMDLYLGKPEIQTNSLQYISQNTDSLDQFLQAEAARLYFLVQKEKEIYLYYPTGIVQMLTQMGGLLAILNVSILMKFMHKRWFDKKINQQIAQRDFTKKEVQEGPLQVEDIYSTEFFHELILRVQQLEAKQSLFDKKNN